MSLWPDWQSNAASASASTEPKQNRETYRFAPHHAGRYKLARATAYANEFKLNKRDKKARLRALCAAKGYHPDNLPGGWATN